MSKKHTNTTKTTRGKWNNIFVNTFAYIQEVHTLVVAQGTVDILIRRVALRGCAHINEIVHTMLSCTCQTLPPCLSFFVVRSRAIEAKIDGGKAEEGNPTKHVRHCEFVVCMLCLYTDHLKLLVIPASVYIACIVLEK